LCVEGLGSRTCERQCQSLQGRGVCRAFEGRGLAY
jgi:hypothetical protein